MSIDKPSHRRFKFDLRSLFILATLVALWLGWSLYRIHQREVTLQYLISRGAIITYGQPIRPWKQLPITWQLFGVKSVQRIESVDKDDRDHIADSFPEAELVVPPDVVITR
jgi:hypothetical protein